MSTTDNRYAITREWCGQSKQMHIVRFCGEWVGKAHTIRHARMIRDVHINNRQLQLTRELIRL